MARFSLLPTVLAALLFLGCGDSDTVDDPEPNNPRLNLLSPAPTPFGAAGGSVELVFASSEAWQITASPANEAWYTISPLSGGPGERITVQITLQPNEAYTPRSLSLTLHTASRELGIVYEQLKKNAIILGENRLEINSQEQVLTVGVQSNVAYEVAIREGAEWIGEEPQGRAGELEHTEHRFRIAANPDAQERTGVIVFQELNSDLSDELTVVQAAWEDPDPERGALKAIYEAAGGSRWTRSDNWCTDKPLGEWYGLETDEEGHVVALNLSHNNLSGTISERIARLTHLQHLDLSWNALEDDIERMDMLSDFVPELVSIDLSHNKLFGEMPMYWYKLGNLTRVDLSSNLLTGVAVPIQWKPMWQNGRTVELNLNDNRLHGTLWDEIQNHPDWDRLALGVIRQNRENLPGIEYDKDIHLPDFTFTDLRDGSQQRIGELVGSNKLTMLLSWDPTQPESTEFMQTVVRRFHTLFKAQGFAVVAITPEGEQYAEAARSYLAGHPLAWPVVTDYADAQGRRTILPAYPYPSYILVDGDGKLLEDIFTGQYCPTLPMTGENYVFDLEERPFQHNDFLNELFRNTFGKSSYHSTDYSMDKQYVALQTATRGKGIDIVLAGDAFTDVDIETGYYRQVMEFAMESFFALEPTKSYRDYFNMWMVYAVSRDPFISTYYSGETALGSYLTDGRINNPLSSIQEYMKPNPDTPVVAVVVNGAVGGLTYYNRSDTRYAFTGYSYGLRRFLAGTFVHESLGHGFGWLADEYVDSEIAEIPESDKKMLKENQNKGRYLNVSLTDDSNAVYWSHLIGHPNYPYVGIHQGGHCYAKGVWRSEYESVMKSSATVFYFDAICRELIVKRILELSGEGFTFEKFLEKDSDEGRRSSASAADQATHYEEIPYKHHPPILVD